MERKKNELLWFALTLIIVTVAFMYLRAYFFEQNQIGVAGIAGLVYGLSFPIFALVFGGKNLLKNLLCKIGFYYNLIAYIIYGVISEMWFLLNFASEYKLIWNIHRNLILWGLALVIHFILFRYLRQSTLKDIHKEEIFD